MEIVNQKPAITKIITFLETFKKQKKKALLLYGPPGVGKTHSIYEIAKELDYEVITLTAEDVRNKNFLEKISHTFKTSSLFAKSKLILIDEIESLSIDRGLPFVIKMIEMSDIPIILIALDYWNPSLKVLRRYCIPIEFKRIDWRLIRNYLIKLANKKNISYDLKAIEFISKNSNGDLRAAITDFLTISAGKKKIHKEDIIFIPERSREENIFEALKKVFQYEVKEDPYDALKNVNIDYKLAILWIAENISKAYKNKKELACAYEKISKADVFLGRIIKRQYYNLQYYAQVLSTAGVAFCKSKSTGGFIRYSSPEKLKKLLEKKEERKVIKAITKKLAKHLHTSSDIIESEYLHLISKILNKSKNAKEFFKKNFDLTESELNFIMGF